MSAHFDLIIRGGTVMLPWGPVATDIGVRAGRIASLDAGSDTADELFDARGLHVLPGMIDPHVHLRDSGQGGFDPAVESIPTGTRAAILGGVCSVFDMPNTNPPAIDAESLRIKSDYIPGHAFCDMGIYVGATKQNADELGALEQLSGVCAVKVFAGSSTGNLLVEDDASIERVLRSGRRRVAFHAEDEYRLNERRAQFSRGQGYEQHAIWRDEECAFLGTRRIVALARKTGRPVHILHTSTAAEFSYLRDHTDFVSVEVLLNHLTQAAPEAYEALGAYAVMNPPIRTAAHRDAAWQAVNNGLVSTIGSDHAPHSHAAKAIPWPDCAAGLTGVQTLLPLMLDHVHAGRLSLGRMVDLMAAGPARIYGALNKGRIAVGMDGDFTIVDLQAKRRISNDWIASPCGWTPFDGVSVTGWPMATIIRGRIVMREDEVLGEPAGRIIAFR
jgi:dihydroorotase